MLIDSIFGWISFYVTAVSWFTGDNINNGVMRFTFLVGRDGTDLGRDLQQSSGRFPRLYVRSTSGRRVGEHWQTGTLESNQQKHVDVPLSQNEEVNYVTAIYAYTDALCVAVMSWAPPSTTHNYQARAGVITGDLFRLCGYDWNHSGQIMRNGVDPDTYASCGWVGTNRGFVNLLNLNLDVMGNHFVKKYKNTNLCGFGVGFQQGWNEGVPKAPFKRSLPTPEIHIAAFGNQVRVHKELSAIELCDSPTSWGSSFLSIKEGVFCDMSTKTKIPVCKVGETDGCFVYEKPRVNGRGGYSTKRNMYVKGSTMTYNATYFVISDESGKIVDDGKGH
ncbi:hypothetical protein BGZ75_008020 [Mortierella antarctica]|nr:hypothetical protein BGZ75_008020 [Mortierella antarctica]